VARPTDVENDQIVWAVEDCGYDSYLIGVAESLEAGVAYLQTEYFDESYIVAWGEPRAEGDLFVLTGDFDFVAGKATQHRGSFRLTPLPLRILGRRTAEVGFRQVSQVQTVAPATVTEAPNG
jgi:hypothetical protein